MVFFNRKLTIESNYYGQASDRKSSLSGIYKGNAPLATDLGIAIGVFREPVFLIGKITYPLHTGGKSNILQDRSIKKIADGWIYFPDDFVQYVEGEPYKGVASDIDGLKIMVTLAIGIPIGS